MEQGGGDDGKRFRLTAGANNVEDHAQRIDVRLRSSRRFKVATTFGVPIDHVYMAKHRVTDLIKEEVKRLEKEMT